MLKLNLGCGTHPKEGYINVDKYPPADIICDLEKEIWPWDNNTVDEILMHHSLEHMGETLQGYFHIWKEIYRVCKPDAKVIITVPHPRHDDFLNDPTHVRAVTAQQLALFNKEENEKWARDGTPNTPLGVHLNIDFVIEKTEAFIEYAYKGWPNEALEKAMTQHNNIVKQTTIILRVRKQ